MPSTGFLRLGGGREAHAEEHAAALYRLEQFCHRQGFPNAAKFTPAYIAHLRALHGLSQAAMASWLGVAARSYRDWERGCTVPTYRHLQRLKDAEEVLQLAGLLPVESKETESQEERMDLDRERRGATWNLDRIDSLFRDYPFSTRKLLKVAGVSPSLLNSWRCRRSIPSEDACRRLDKLEAYLQSLDLPRVYQYHASLIKRMRALLGLSCREAADLYGVSYSTYICWENATRRPCRADQLRALETARKRLQAEGHADLDLLPLRTPPMVEII